MEASKPQQIQQEFENIFDPQMTQAWVEYFFEGEETACQVSYK
jgi:hypothetical protein